MRFVLRLRAMIEIRARMEGLCNWPAMHAKVEA